MTESGRQEVKARLIELGFWMESEKGDPATDPSAAGALRKRIEGRIAAQCVMPAGFADEEMTRRRARLVGPGIDHAFSADEDMAIAICRAALELPEFLKEYPECAAGDWKPDPKSSKKAAKKQGPE
jgi:hypothetical protein